MRIGGLHKVSLIDYPGKIATVVFTAGCNFRCPYCHNPELVDPKEGAPDFPWSTVMDFLERRRGLLDGVVVTGGEPTLHSDLPEALKQIKGLGFSVKLDTNGTSPHVLRGLIEQQIVDYLAMDIKAPLERYRTVVRAVVDTDDIRESTGLIMGSELKYEFRTTLVPGLHDEADVRAMVKTIRGAHRYVLQTLSGTACLDPAFQNIAPFSPDQMARFQAIAQDEVSSCSIRDK
ncbi:MAG: anaerobic ribonucleoside-triphosphate reductase activating protein [Candidatus Latescibacteria bacterium]|nr:anaerobic ribonucleoside-triphosphate reductase activating protein [Candidatus Latescibacterota bacterium]